MVAKAVATSNNLRIELAEKAELLTLRDAARTQNSGAGAEIAGQSAYGFTVSLTNQQVNAMQGGEKPRVFKDSAGN